LIQKQQTNDTNNPVNKCFFDIENTLIASTICLFMGSVYLIVSKRNVLVFFIKESFYLLLLFLVFKTSSLILGFSRNPGLEKQLFAYAILGFALTEAIALFGLMMAFLILFGF